MTRDEPLARANEALFECWRLLEAGIHPHDVNRPELGGRVEIPYLLALRVTRLVREAVREATGGAKP